MSHSLAPKSFKERVFDSIVIKGPYYVEYGGTSKLKENAITVSCPKTKESVIVKIQEI